MLKYAVGLDISSDVFHACIGIIDLSQVVTFKSSRKFDNNKAGFEALGKWISQEHKQQAVPLSICMEATGVYYEGCAMWLYLAGYQVAVILPNKASNYLKATGSKSKNDRIDARGLCRMAAEQALEAWQPMDDYFYQLRSLTRQMQALQELKTVVGNQLHAEMHSQKPFDFVLNQLNAQLEFADQQVKHVQLAINDHIATNEQVAQKVQQVCQIKGVSILTVAVILAETNGFLLFKNARQLVSFAGYDVVENQSGKQAGKTRISKKGNSRLRRAMHLPAFNVVRYKQTPFLQLYERTLPKHQVKMKSYVAVQKKLLVIIYALWKNNTAYVLEYNQAVPIEEKIASTNG